MNIVEALKKVQQDLKTWATDIFMTKIDKENPVGMGEFSFDGNAWISGDVYVASAEPDDETAKKVATEEFVTERELIIRIENGVTATTYDTFLEHIENFGNNIAIEEIVTEPYNTILQGVQEVNNAVRKYKYHSKEILSDGGEIYCFVFLDGIRTRTCKVVKNTDTDLSTTLELKFDYFKPLSNQDGLMYGTFNITPGEDLDDPGSFTMLEFPTYMKAGEICLNGATLTGYDSISTLPEFSLNGAYLRNVEEDFVNTSAATVGYVEKRLGATLEQTGDVTIEFNVNYVYKCTDVTSLVVESNSIPGGYKQKYGSDCMGVVTFSSSADPTSIVVNGVTGMTGDDIYSAKAGETWEFNCMGGRIIWYNWGVLE